MELELTGADRSFYDEVQEVLAPFAGLESYVVSSGRETVDRFYRVLAERNWLALSWPESAGGLGRPPLHEFLLWNEAAFRNIARPPQGAGIIAKTIIRHGAPDQKRLWLERIRLHQATFALVYSEPAAGSDLARLRCRAVADGDAYVVNGNKCWNSKAHLVDYLWLLCRTGPLDSGKRGLSLFIVDAKAPGVTIRPIRLMDGNYVTEIFFDDVRVPAEARIGAENEAWSLIGEALADERHVHFSPGRVRHDYFIVRGWLEARGLLDDAAARARIDGLAVDVLEAEALALSVLDAREHATAAAAANKVINVRVMQDIARAALDIGGTEAMIRGEPPEILWRQTMTESVGGGTNEIMESIVARQRLGLKSTR